MKFIVTLYRVKNMLYTIKDIDAENVEEAIDKAKEFVLTNGYWNITNKKQMKEELLVDEVIKIPKNKFNIGDTVIAKVNFINDPRNIVDATIYGVYLENDTIKYKIQFEPTEKDKKKGCTGCNSVIKEEDIIGGYL